MTLVVCGRIDIDFDNADADVCGVLGDPLGRHEYIGERVSHVVLRVQ